MIAPPQSGSSSSVGLLQRTRRYLLDLDCSSGILANPITDTVAEGVQDAIEATDALIQAAKTKYPWRDGRSAVVAPQPEQQWPPLWG